MTLKPGMQAIAIHILFNISRSKDNQTMKFGQLIEYKKTTFFIKKSSRKRSMKISTRLLLVFKKTLYEVKASGLHLSFNIL